MPYTRIRKSLPLALGAALLLISACSEEGEPLDAGQRAEGGPVVAVATAWEGAMAKAAGAGKVVIIMPSLGGSAASAPDAAALSVVNDADFVLYSTVEPFAATLKKAAVDAESEPVEVTLDNDPAQLKAQVDKLAEQFETQKSADAWKSSFDTASQELTKELQAARRSGRAPSVVSHSSTAWVANLAGATVVGRYGPRAATGVELNRLSSKKPDLVFGDPTGPTGAPVAVLQGAKQVNIVNVPGDDLDLLAVYRNAAAEVKKALEAP